MDIITERYPNESEFNQNQNRIQSRACESEFNQAIKSILIRFESDQEICINQNLFNFGSIWFNSQAFYLTSFIACDGCSELELECLYPAFWTLFLNAAFVPSLSVSKCSFTFCFFSVASFHMTLKHGTGLLLM